VQAARWSFGFGGRFPLDLINLFRKDHVMTKATTPPT
jgi:hypothetical protein